MTKSPLLVSWSGGKDAAWALHALRAQGDVEVVGLLTTMADDGRVSAHGLRRAVLRAQAEAVGLPVLEALVPAGAGNGAYEAALADALAGARSRWPGLAAIAFGDLFLADVKAYRDALCARLGWAPRYPLFGRDTRALAGQMIDGGLRAIVCCVDTQQLRADVAGRDFDRALLDDLPAAVDPCGENGEFHTCAYAGPMFARPLALERGGAVRRDGRFVYAELNPAATRGRR